MIRLIAISPLLGSLVSSPVALAGQSRSDISVTLAANQRGETITYTATMTNHGPDDATSVDVGFALPVQLRLVSMSCDKGISPDTPFCEYSSLRAGETVVSILVAKVNVGARQDRESVTTTARVSFESDCAFDPNCTFDPDLSNNSASVTTRLTGK